jgi:internalin A
MMEVPSGTGSDYVLEDSPEGRTLVVTGSWSDEAAEVLARGEADGLVLNYARGFSEVNLEFLAGWKVRRLNVLDRGIVDLDPIGRLGASLEELSVQAAPGAGLALAELPYLRSISGEWGMLRDALTAVQQLRSVRTWQFDEADLRAFRDHVQLERLSIREAPHLESLAGAADLPDLAVLGVFLARKLNNISDVAEHAASLRHLEFEDCGGIDLLDDVEGLVKLRFLAVSDCGEIESLGPVGPLEEIEVLHAWGTTRIVDEDLSPLERLPRLREIRMRDRPGYKPRVSDLVAALST